MNEKAFFEGHTLAKSESVGIDAFAAIVNLRGGNLCGFLWNRLFSESMGLVVLPSLTIQFHTLK
jgi:hypothetical protein